ncbi:MAG TPA: amidohydrolase family protein [Puia sp.]|nr:amidohydrolase family protein [Puia sp.]
MLLRNLSVIGREGLHDILFDQDGIRTVEHSATSKAAEGKTAGLIFNQAIAFPGLINSHDHLDFNLFQQLGNTIYHSYEEWGRQLHKEHKDQINEILNIPLALRISWGIYKNLLNGFTTVVNHGQKLHIRDHVIQVIQPANNLHSVKFEKNWKWKINRPGFKKQPYAVHVGEGTNEEATKEIDQLIQYNLFDRELIGIHAVAMQEKQASAFKCLVWCPASNYFLLNQTAPVDRLNKYTRIIFGTDSTLTAPWNAWEHLRAARASKLVSDETLFHMLTDEPASVWGLTGRGAIKPGMMADIVIAKKNPVVSGWDAFYALNPGDILLIIQNGMIRLFDEELIGPIMEARYPVKDFGMIDINGSYKYVQGHLPELMDEIRKHHSALHFPFTN